MRRVYWGLGILLAVQIQPAWGAETKQPWIHVRVEEAKDDSKVSVNLPLSLAQIALNSVPETSMVDGKFHIMCKDKGMSVAQMRQAWAELSAAGDADFVTVKEENETVRIARQGDKVRIMVAEPSGKTETVNVDVPVAALDALFKGEGESLNVKGALEEIQKIRGDVVRVDDGKSKVRIWIDEEI